MYSHNDRSKGMPVKKGCKQPPRPKDVTGMLPALPSIELCKKQQKKAGWLQGKQRQQGKQMRGQGSAGEIRMPGKANCLLLYSYSYYSLHFPSSASCQSNFSYRECFVRGRLNSTSYPKNMQFNKEMAQLNTTHFDLVWVPALLLSVSRHFKANTVFPLQRTCKQRFSQQRLTRCPITKAFFKHMQRSLLATGDVPLTTFSPLFANQQQRLWRTNT